MADEVVFTEAPNSVIHTAETLIKQYHPALQMARIAFVMRSEAQKRGERKIIGSTTKVPAKMQPHLEYDYLIWLSQDDYDMMSTGEREALIDHELMHCKYNPDTGTWGIREHDIQEFSEIVSRHGLWSADLRRMDKAAETYRQLPLGDTITISSGGRVATVTGDQLEKIAKNMGA